MPKLKVMITGSNGFVGSAISRVLEKTNFKLVKPLRSDISLSNNQKIVDKNQIIDGISPLTNWEHYLDGVDTVIHCAAITDTEIKVDSNYFSALRSINVDGTLNLARQAVSQGIRRFIFISSIKVNGDSTSSNCPFVYDDNPCPLDAYGKSKYEAEKGLWEISRKSKLEIVIIRPPLVYGPNVKGNFAKLIKLVKYGFPLPLLKIKNERSFIGVDNLADLVVRCIKHPKALNQVLLASDDHDLSTPDLLRYIAKAMGKRSILLPFSPEILFKIASFFNQNAVADRLLRSLQVDISYTKNLLDWSPPVDIETGLRRCFQKPLK